jgi:uncharacterized protein YceH (UPF0502 family)
MDFTISPVEARILGCLIEKEATTPDVYPLTLNGLLTACNQKSNREPVMQLGVDDLEEALDTLRDRTLVSTWQSNRDRMAKYQHKLRDRISDQFDFSAPELAVLGVLFLRGPQTVGEIRSRCARIHNFDNLGEVEDVLDGLAQNPDGPYVKMLPRQAGRKESRYAHLFCGEPEEGALPDPVPVEGIAPGESRVEGLEREVSELKADLEALRQRFEAFAGQFE